MANSAFAYKGIHSTTFGIISKNIDRTLLSNMKTNKVDIPGRDGAFDLGDNTYENRQIKVHIAFLEEDYTGLRRKTRDIAAWLHSEKPEKLIFDDEPDKYYMARLLGNVSVSQWYKLGEADLTFDCQPFAYSDDHEVDETNITTWRNVQITNGGTYKTYPIIEITGTATSITLASDGGSFAISNITQKTVVDCEKMLCYTLDGLNQKANKLMDFTGSFITLQPGELDIMISGVSLNVQIKFIIRNVYL